VTFGMTFGKLWSVHLNDQNNMKIVEMLEKKVEKFDNAFRDKCVAERNYEKLEMYVLELLMQG